MRKIIRDRYDEIIDASRLSVVSDDREYYNMMLDKLEEELGELQDSNFTDINEFADVFEVLYALAKAEGISRDQLITATNCKKFKKGGFEKGLILTKKQEA